MWDWRLLKVYLQPFECNISHSNVCCFTFKCISYWWNRLRSFYRFHFFIVFIAFCLELRSQPHGFHTCHNQRPFHGTFAFGQGLKTPELNWNSMKPLRTPELGNMAQHFPRHAPRQATEQATKARHGLRHPAAHLATIVEKMNLTYLYLYICICDNIKLQVTWKLSTDKTWPRYAIQNLDSFSCQLCRIQSVSAWSSMALSPVRQSGSVTIGSGGPSGKSGSVTYRKKSQRHLRLRQQSFILRGICYFFWLQHWQSTAPQSRDIRFNFLTSKIVNWAKIKSWSSFGGELEFLNSSFWIV